mmetsp:Transcript_115127/g.203188  ORF Transcript_115127/g.203188 Transcript_115127/m.203188 type:complete len:384 (-) Transcript_115127:61-1212(-)
MELPGMIQDEPAGGKSAPPTQQETPGLTKVEPVNLLPPTDRAGALQMTAATDYPEDAPEKGPPPGRLKRHWRLLAQQEVRPSRGPLLWYSRPAQAVCGGCCAALFILIAIVLLSASVSEVVVPYGADMEKEFDVPKDLKGPVHVSYEMPNVLLNHKNAVQGKDRFLWRPPIINDYTCYEAESLQDAQWRRTEVKFQEILSGNDSPSLPNLFRPCGLVAIAMFVDDFKLERSDGTEVKIEETEITLPKDDEIYEKKILPIEGKTATSPLPHYTIDGHNSWLRMGAPYEHFKVWYRTSAAPIARNFWGRIPGDLQAGKYKLKFEVNSPVWKTSWGVEEKRIIFSESNTFGNGGACKVLGIFSVIIGVCEALVAIAFVVDLKLRPG